MILLQVLGSLVILTLIGAGLLKFCDYIEKRNKSNEPS